MNSLFVRKIRACINLSLVCLISCNNNVNVAKESKINLRFYFRDILGHNEYKTYADNLVIENYSNNIYTMNELADIAIRYIDTVKADRHLTGVTFLGEQTNNPLPLGMWKNAEKYSKYFVVAFDFNNSLESDSIHNKSKIVMITMYENGEPKIYDEQNVDSLLRTKSLLNNKVE